MRTRRNVAPAAGPASGPGQLPRARTGAVMGMTGAALSFMPTLIPRSTRDQILVTATTTLACHGLGALAQAVIEAVPLQRDSLRGRLVATGLVGCAAVASRTALRPHEEEGILHATGRATSGLLAYSSLAAAGSLAVDATTLNAGQRSRAQGLAIPASAWAAGIAATVALAERGLRAQQVARTDYDPPAPSLRRTIMVSGVAVAGTEIGMLAGEYAIARAARLLARRLPGTDRAWTAALSVGLGAAAGTAAYSQWAKVAAKFRASNASIEAGYADPPAVPYASGSVDSAVPYETLGLQGRRFVKDRITAEEIERVMGEPARAEPIRLYVGMDTDPEQATRVHLALAELERSGAYDRDLLILASPSGTGYVNSIPVETAEYLTRGSVATVALQYDRKPSVLSLDKATEAAFQNRLLLSGIVLALRSRPRERRPRIVLYGESLGAHTSQDMFIHQGTLGIEVMGVDRALWVGTPYASAWHRQVLTDRRADADPALVRTLRWGSDAAATTGEERDQTPIWLLDHPEDPVARFGLDLLVQRPEWMGRGAPDRPVPRQTFWWPVVTFMGVLVDTVNAARVVPGEFRAFGHDYRADLARTVSVAYRLLDVTPSQADAIERALRASEKARSERIALGTLDERNPVARLSASVISAADTMRAQSHPAVEPVPEPTG